MRQCHKLIEWKNAQVSLTDCSFREEKQEVTMVRKLKFHEQKLLRKVNFVSWEVRKDMPSYLADYCISLGVMIVFHSVDDCSVPNIPA